MPEGTVITEQIVIGTPGKMIDWAWRLKFFDVSKIKVCFGLKYYLLHDSCIFSSKSLLFESHPGDKER